MTLYDEEIYLTTPPHLPTAPLFDAFHQAGHTSLQQISLTTGISAGCLSITRKRGTINQWWADQLITQHLNQHPFNVYGDAWLHASSYRAGRIDSIFEGLTGVAS
jgi:hypothetical protein